MTRSEPQTFSAQMDSLPLAAGFVQAFCAQQRVASDDTLRLTLIVEELFTNAVVHGHGGGSDAPVRLVLGIDSARLVLHFEDRGPRFDPLQYLAEAAPPLDAPADERRVGGLGLPLVAQMAEQFEYAHAEGWNRLRLVLKNLA
jgi:serine/threonine-protein kinase RsbW